MPSPALHQLLRLAGRRALPRLITRPSLVLPSQVGRRAVHASRLLRSSAGRPPSSDFIQPFDEASLPSGLKLHSGTCLVTGTALELLTDISRIEPCCCTRSSSSADSYLRAGHCGPAGPGGHPGRLGNRPSVCLLLSPPSKPLAD